VAESNRDVDALRAALASERSRVDTAMQQLETLATELWSWRRRAEQLEAERAGLSARLGYYEETVRNMERSWFWRARLLVTRLTGRGGRRAH